ncbi:hypothetical protein [Rubrimonas cliftonensis]|uniref:hypothetical protein n=1 Tax=Rubrimonas cliftonensis TaxID=89524 RepID=UPI00158728B6|nr:hypothetical protein [Rubrimonas cliftonensis]
MNRRIFSSVFFARCGVAKSPDAQRAARKALQHACAIYEELATTLTAVIMHLRNEEGRRPLDPDEMGVIRAHQKAVLMVLDYEAKLLRRHVGVQRASERAIDLDAARAEVARRLAGLAGAQST